MKEIDLALELEFTMRKMGSDGVAFPFIVVSGQGLHFPTVYRLKERSSPAILLRLILEHAIEGIART